MTTTTTTNNNNNNCVNRGEMGIPLVSTHRSSQILPDPHTQILTDPYTHASIEENCPNAVNNASPCSRFPVRSCGRERPIISARFMPSIYRFGIPIPCQQVVKVCLHSHSHDFRYGSKEVH